MFDFEKLLVYQKAKQFNAQIRLLIKQSKFDAVTKDQLRRAAFSIPLNIAEGSGRFARNDRRNFLIIARGSVFECVAIIDILKDEKLLDQIQFDDLYHKADELSRILFAMIQNIKQKTE